MVATRLAPLAVGCAGVVLALAGGARPAESTFRGSNGRIVYQTPAGLMLVSDDGTGATRIPGSSGRDQQPSWSADGRRIVYESTRSGDVDLYVMNGNGSRVRELTFTPAFDGDASWYPDGSRIAFESDRAQNVDIWRMRADGGSQSRLTTAPAFDGDPAVSPDGTRIAFTSERDGNREIYVMNADGSGQTRLTFTGGRQPAVEGIDENPSWSPDGSQLAFDSTRDGNWELYVMNADGSEQTRLTDHPALDAIPAWSPDGTQIVFESERAGRNTRHLYVLNASGGGVRRLTSGRELAPDWQALGPAPRGCTIWGTTGDDLLTGTPGRDVICGGLGNDTLRGLGGADTLDGGFGNDVLEGGPGNDRLVGGYDRDVLLGGAGLDRLEARDGARDRVDGGGGFDRARVDPRLDRVSLVERRF